MPKINSCCVNKSVPVFYSIQYSIQGELCTLDNILLMSSVTFTLTSCLKDTRRKILLRPLRTQFSLFFASVVLRMKNYLYLQFRSKKKALEEIVPPMNVIIVVSQCVFFGAVKDGGQKFCSQSCLRTSRLMEASVDIPEGEIHKYATTLKLGACPACRKKGSNVELRKYYWVWSAAIITQWGHHQRFAAEVVELSPTWHLS